MRTSVLPSWLAIAVACSPAEEPPPATAAVSLADFAGEWTMNVMGESSDSVTLTYDMTASADPAGWMVTFPGQDPMPVTVTLEGDSVMGTIGPYDSFLRPGLRVTTDFVARTTDGTVHGTFAGRYQTGAADSVSRGRIQGMRKTR